MHVARHARRVCLEYCPARIVSKQIGKLKQTKKKVARNPILPCSLKKSKSIPNPLLQERPLGLIDDDSARLAGTKKKRKREKMHIK